MVEFNPGWLFWWKKILEVPDALDPGIQTEKPSTTTLCQALKVNYAKEEPVSRLRQCINIWEEKNFILDNGNLY